MYDIIWGAKGGEGDHIYLISEYLGMCTRALWGQDTEEQRGDSYSPEHN